MSGFRPLRACSVILLTLCAALVAPPAFTAERPAQIDVAYFQQWPAPAQFAQARQTFDAVLGLQVNWRPYRSGAQMTAALASGEVQIAYSLGHVPFLVGVNAGTELTMVGVAVSYPEDDNCILRADAGIERTNLAALAGQKVAVRIGSVTHFRLLGVLDHLGVDAAQLQVVPVSDGAEALQALQDGEVAMACAYGASLRKMQALGKPLLSGAEQQALGLPLFDVVAVSTAFAQQYPGLIENFVRVVDAANRQWRANPQPMQRLIARAADMDRGSAAEALQRFHFPPADEQRTEAWMGGRVATYSAELARFFVANGQLEQSLDNYDRFIDTRFLP